MKVVLSLLLINTGIICSLAAQAPLQTAGPSFSSKDTTKADVVAIASLQTFPVGFDLKGLQQDTIVKAEQVQIADAPLPAPIQDWHNPPGYLGSSRPAGTMTRHKPLKAKKYQRPKPNRCYTF